MAENISPRNTNDDDGIEALSHLMSEEDTQERSGNTGGSPEDEHPHAKWYFIAAAILLIGGFFVYQGQTPKETPVENTQAVEEGARQFAANDLAGAEENARAALQRDPDDITAKLLLASTLLQRGSVQFEEETYADQAIDIAEEVLDKDPENAEAHRILGYAYEIKQEYETAIEHYDQAIDIDPDMALAYSQKGHARELSESASGGEWWYLEALAIDPTLDHALLNMARIHYMREEFTESQEALNDLYTFTDFDRFRAEGKQIEGLIALSEDRLADAEQLFSEAVSIDNTLVAAHAGLAEAKLYLLNETADLSDGEFNTALQEIVTILERINGINAEYTPAYTLMAQVFLMAEDEENARTLLEQAKDVAQTDITMTADQRTEYIAYIDELLSNIE